MSPANPPRHLRALAALLASLALAACGEEPAQAPPAKPPAPAPAPKVAAAGGPAKPAPDARPAAVPAVFRGRMRKLSAYGDELRTRIDPARDGWPTEAFAARLESRLREAVARGLAREGSLGGELAALASDGFAGATALHAERLASVFDDGNTSVLRPAELDRTLRPKADLAAAADAWKAAFADDPAPVAYLHVSALQEAAGGKTETVIDLRVSGASGAGRLQHNVRWNAVWTRAEQGGEPRLDALELAAFEEVRVRRAPFADVTGAVFGANACWKEEFLRGAHDYHLRQDRLSSQPFLAMHGIAIGDVDGDGREDVYVAQPGGQPNRLFVHREDGTAVDVAVEAGVAYLDNCGPALLCDFDGDGDQDLAVAARENVLVSWNDGRGRFSDGIVLLGGDEPEITSMSAADPDLDGDLDIFAVRYVKGGVMGGAPTPYHAAENGARDLYWRNEGGRRFKEAAAEVGLDAHSYRFGLSLTWEDYDEDGDDDLYVVNDFGRNTLFRNDGGRFTDVAEQAGVVDQAAGMGVTCGDVDLDGDIDLFNTNMHTPAGSRVATQPQFAPRPRDAYVYHARGNTLLLARGDGTYEDATERAGVAHGGWAWGSVFYDQNDDGYPDLHVPNGFASNFAEPDLASFFWRGVVNSTPAAPPPDDRYQDAADAIRHFNMFEGLSWNGWEREYHYLNLGDARFADVSAAFGVDFLDDGRAVAPIDWDDDGRVDLLLKNRTAPRLRLLRNTGGGENRSVALDLVGTRSNRDAIGARVTLVAGGRTLRQNVYAAQGFLCGTSRRLHFGLARADAVESVEVRWPGGARERFEGVAPGARFRLVEGSGRAERVERRREVVPAKAPHEPRVESREAPPKVERVVAFDRLPVAALELPAYEGAPRRVGDLAKEAGILVTVAQVGDERSKASLAALAARAREVASPHVVLALDDARSIAAARAWLAEHGLGRAAGPADKRVKDALEVLLIEVLGPFDELPLPLHLLVDRQGNLCAFHCGGSPAEAVLADLARVRALEPGRDTEALLGGHWARLGSRDLAQVTQIFQLLGRADLARYYKELDEARR